MAVTSAGLGTKNACADEGQQQFTSLDWTGKLVSCASVSSQKDASMEAVVYSLLGTAIYQRLMNIVTY
jgi:hypothetical protein